MGTHPIFESDFDCLTEPMPAAPPPPPAPLPIKPIGTSEIGNPGQIAKIAFDSRETGILDLSRSGLSNFPNGVIKLSDGSKVKKVILSGNALKTLPRDFSQFYEATEIDLSDNNFSHFAICFTDMYNLHTINLSRNKFETISELEMEKMPAKTKLILSGNPIDDKGKQVIRKFNKKAYNIIV